MSNTNIYFVVVIYNKDCEDSPSFKYALANHSLLKIIVVDNSEIKTNNEVYCSQKGIPYISMNGNAGLSKAYNKALEYIKDNKGFIIWADDDTSFPYNYLEDMLALMNNNHLSVGLPLVMTSDHIYSPSIFDKYGIPKRIKSLTDLSERLTGINSGMIVDLDVYSSYRYDEEMFLDFIDHDFCWACNKAGRTIGFTNRVILQQESFFSSKLNIRSLMIRRHIFRRDFIRFCDKNDIRKIVGWKTLFNGEIAIVLKFLRQILNNE